ncbi:glucokinase [Nannizzia gypsea CBS 118893]|uniref:Phosphotransferase n=1 Tax=Arthroderma gypseum (strain ATCC MYA-4604 / CBS 118893) TaxID=535722 RepID=E5R0K3_ARTGP|nr:glucokinase [Nannizzia gypsea CBS 118893]EFQ98347.1 glucokinase [Nannizzia gypsea CBS 118893]
MASAVLEEAKRISAGFEYSTEELNKGVEEFLHEMEVGLSQNSGSGLSQIPTYITSMPDGTEKGVYLAVDLGGTNLRVCSVNLHGDSTHSMIQSKSAIPRELMVAEHGSDLFNFLAKQIEAFLREHHSEQFSSHIEKRQTGEVNEPYAEEQVFDLGFTFSFPVIQHGINKGELYRWTKGFDIPEVIGKDICQLLQTAIDELKLPVRVAALINDTVGTLMARSYCSPGSSTTLIGAIFGTGTNGAYVEKMLRVKKMEQCSSSAYNKSAPDMVINAEWGSFDNALKVLPNTEFDIQLDNATFNPGVQMFEKRISGMFLGEILRLAILSMVENPSVSLFGSPATIDKKSTLYQAWAIDASILSIVESDNSEDLQAAKEQIRKDLNITDVSTSDCQAVKLVAHSIGKRAARLGAIALGAIVISSGRLATDEMVDIGVDGSLIEHYPGFEGYIREAFREIPAIGPAGEKKIRVGIAKDGSGVGAALGALVAKKTSQTLQG